MSTREDLPPNTRVKLNFYTCNRIEDKIGTVVDELSPILNSKLRGCVMVRWDNDQNKTVPVHPSNLDVYTS